jgi:ferric-dicitrate binding protein FerR (iron transport regulator)
LLLEGEAFFQVAKGSRFDVETASGIVTVEGTQFNVKVRKDFFEVVCYEGLVEVRSTGRVTQLPPTKVFRAIKGVVTEHADTSEAQPGWLSNESSFESVPFAEVIEEFERQYGVSVTSQNVDPEKRFTGRFGHSDFHKALQSISIPLNLTVKVSADQKHVVLSSEVN